MGKESRPEIEEQITFLYVEDLERSSAFYRGIMGLELVLEQAHCRIYRTGRTAYLGICEGKDRVSKEDQKGVIFTLVVSDVKGWYTHLLEQGWTVPEEPKYNEMYLITHFFFRDPDGYLIEVQSFEDPRWKGPSVD